MFSSNLEILGITLTIYREGSGRTDCGVMGKSFSPVTLKQVMHWQGH